MKASRRWLEAFLRRPLEVREVVEQLALLGAPVDAVEPLHGGLAAIRVALVEAVRPHPDADRLRVCTVNDGGPERRNVVCGAPNVVAGGKYPFAPVGAALPGGIVIAKRKLRGELSEGMLCSPRELGLGEDHDGLLTLDTDAPPGTPLLEVLPIGDDRLDVDVSPVRPDLLGHKGIARELAALARTPFRLPEIPGARPLAAGIRRTAASGSTGGIAVSIEAGSSCRRFTGAVVRGVMVGPSPDWLRQRLEAVGVRSISNVVDATNYVMFELGQPLHAYDLARLSGAAITARVARAGETLVTLDGAERALPAGLTVIADGARAVGVAGVMGGRDSEVTGQTTDLFLECAWFAPGPTRSARRALGLATEASQRFERGTDLWGVPDALRRCVEVIVAVAGGTPDGDAVDCWPEPAAPPRIFLRAARVAQVLGLELPAHVLEQCLLAVGATVVAKPEEGRLAVDAPGWRPDLREEIDLIEEIARVHGFAAFPDELRPFRAGNQVDAPIEVAVRGLRAGLVAEGLLEAILLPMGPADHPEAVAVLNPLSADHRFLRSRLLPGLVRQAEGNWASHVRDIRLFEIGTVFRFGGSGGRPLEATHAAALISGARAPAHWTDGGATPDADLWDLKGLFERAVALANPRAAVQVEGEGWRANLPDGREIGRAGPLAADAPPWAGALYGLEVEVDPAPRPIHRFVPLPATPATARDLALVVPPGVSVAAIREGILGAAGRLLESVEVIDEYRGAELPAGRRGVALRLVFRAPDRTLRDAEVDAVVQRVLTTLGKSLDVTLRTA